MKFPVKKSGSKLTELVVICLILGIVFFVLFAVYKSMDNISNIRRIDSIRSPYMHRGGFNEGFGYNEGFANPNKRNIEYSAYPEGQPLDSGLSKMIDKAQTPQCGKVWGFNGVFCEPEVSDTMIDAFYSASSDESCEGSGLTKGRGNLCLDKLQRQLLTTRGGNSVYDSVIG